MPIVTESEQCDVTAYQSKVSIQILKDLIKIFEKFIKYYEQVEVFGSFVSEFDADTFVEMEYEKLVRSMSKTTEHFNNTLKDMIHIQNSPDSIICKLINDGHANDIFRHKFPIKKSLDLLEGDDTKRVCIIVNILRDSEEFYFYDLTNFVIYKEFFTQIRNLSKCIKPLGRHPRCCEIFGVKHSGIIYRAVKENSILNTDQINCFLLDYGVEILVDVNDNTIYELPTSIKYHPAMALRSKLNSFWSQDPKLTKANFYENLFDLNRKFYYKVVKKQNDIYYVDMGEFTNPFLNLLTESEQYDLNFLFNESFEDEDSSGTDKDLIENLNKSMSKCQISSDNFTNMVQNNSNNSTPRTNNTPRTNSVIKNFALQTTTNEIFEMNENNNLQTTTNEIFEVNINNKPAMNQLTEYDKEILFEEPLNTSNALKAVMGYVPKDDMRICKNAQNGECFKGGRCQFSHEQKLASGFTRDTEVIVIRNRCAEELPSVGSTITIEPTAIESCTSFFAQISPSADKICTEPTIGELTRKWNSHEELAMMNTFSDTMPALLELVFAKYLDGLFYRARIIQNVDENFVIVIFLDYGNVEIVSFKDLRKWEHKFEVIPFQAVHFTFDGVKVVPERKDYLIDYLKNEILNKTFIAKVISNIDSVYVQLQDPDKNINVNEKMIEEGFFVRWHNIYPREVNHRVPG